MVFKEGQTIPGEARAAWIKEIHPGAEVRLVRQTLGDDDTVGWAAWTLRANRLVVCDTDPFATAIWHERYMGGLSDDVRAIADARRYDLYLLTGDEIPFAQDGVRDGEHVRHWMHGRFEEALRETGRPYAVLRGSREERLRDAVSLVDAILAGAREKAAA